MAPAGADAGPDRLVAAFEGWNDAGDAATTAARHLRDVWDLDLVAELDPEEFYSFTDTRPQVTFDEGGLRRIEWPAQPLLGRRDPRQGP